MSYINLLVHAIWATKDRKPLMNLEQKTAICRHIGENAITKNITVHQVNGYTDHVHALLSLTAEQSLANVINLLKGESSYWANRNLKLKEKFSWQDKYAGFSVSPRDFNRVYNYIANQELHHRSNTFQEEYDEFLRIHSLETQREDNND